MGDGSRGEQLWETAQPNLKLIDTQIQAFRDGSVFSQGSVQVTLSMLSGLSNSSSLHSLMAYKAFQVKMPTINSHLLLTLLK